MSKFDDDFRDYISIGRSAMTERVESGMLFGRPFGGVITLIHKRIRSAMQTIYCEERFVIVKVSNYLIANVYLPCSGTSDRLSIYDNILVELSAWRDTYLDCEFIIAGDFNVDLSSNSDAACCVNDFISEQTLHRCDMIYPDGTAECRHLCQ